MTAIVIVCHGVIEVRRAEEEGSAVGRRHPPHTDIRPLLYGSVGRFGDKYAVERINVYGVDVFVDTFNVRGFGLVGHLGLKGVDIFTELRTLVAGESGSGSFAESEVRADGYEVRAGPTEGLIVRGADIDLARFRGYAFNRNDAEVSGIAPARIIAESCFVELEFAVDRCPEIGEVITPLGIVERSNLGNLPRTEHSAPVAILDDGPSGNSQE